jgi:hypothetical protein
MMRRKLSLSKETLRILDDEDLALVAGGAGDPHPKTGQHGSCNANEHPKTGQHGSCNATK